MDVLDEDEDMVLMNLSRQPQGPRRKNSADDHEDVEVLYESCHTSVNTVLTRLELTQHMITNSEVSWGG